MTLYQFQIRYLFCKSLRKFDQQLGNAWPVLIVGHGKWWHFFGVVGHLVFIVVCLAWPYLTTCAPSSYLGCTAKKKVKIVKIVEISVKRILDSWCCNFKTVSYAGYLLLPEYLIHFEIDRYLSDFDLPSGNKDKIPRKHLTDPRNVKINLIIFYSYAIETMSHDSTFIK